MSLEKLFKRTYDVKKKRNWTKLYVSIDLHDTIIPSSYSTTNTLEVYEGAKEALQALTEDKEIVLILFTSSYPEQLKPVYDMFEENGIHFDYLNENPVEKSSETGDFSKKFYTNIILDDKAGFDPETDWEEVLCNHRKLK